MERINSGTFYFAGVTPWDWTVPQSDALWQDGTKTLFDPCPAGWRVPRSGMGVANPWSAFGSDPYAAPFFYYINGTKQTAAGKPVFVAHPNNGRRYDRGNGSATAWYPTPGFRESGSNGLFGTLTAVGYGGYYWSSAIRGTSGLRLDFGPTWLTPSFADSRGYGFPVRCLRE